MLNYYSTPPHNHCWPLVSSTVNMAKIEPQEKIGPPLELPSEVLEDQGIEDVKPKKYNL